MNKPQRLVLFAAAAVIGLMLLFPPRTDTFFDYRTKTTRTEFTGHRFILDPWHLDEPMAFGQLFGQFGAVLTLAGVLVLAFRE